MTTLCLLSDEIIELILQFETSALFYLWGTGSRVLQTKIARSCRKFSIGDAKRDFSLFQWPSILAELKALHSVRISVSHIYEDLNSITEHVKCLPRSITELELLFRDAELLPFCNSRNPAWRTLTANSEGIHEVWSFAEYFPALKRLSLPDTAALIVTEVPLSKSSSAIFPDSLEVLRWNASLNPYNADFSLLPRGLTELSLALSFMTTAQVATLPPSLKILRGATLFNDENLRAAPQSLELLNMAKTCLELTPRNAPSLPSGLRTLYLSSNFSYWSPTEAPWQQSLPPNLTYLYGAAGPPAKLALLPKTITALHGAFLQESNLYVYTTPDNQLSSCWPPSLTDLEFSPFSSFKMADHIRILPSTLKKVRGLSFDTGTIWEECHNLPRSLTYLHSITSLMSFCRSSATANTESLPPGLTYLSAQNILPPDSFAGLPRCLVTLELTRNVILNEKVAVLLAHLPSTLTTLTLHETEPVAFPYIPRSVRHLWITFFNSSAVDYSSLPYGLLSLHLNTTSTVRLDPNSFTTFPPSLRLFSTNAVLTIEHFISLGKKVRVKDGFQFDLESAATTKESFAALSRAQRLAINQCVASRNINAWKLEIDGTSH